MCQYANDTAKANIIRVCLIWRLLDCSFTLLEGKTVEVRSTICIILN